ncbi:hypothetical protein BH09PSE2_BH09PSE2_03690 [soil metagenome]
MPNKPRFSLRKPDFLNQPPFARPSRADWARLAARLAADRVGSRAEKAAHAVSEAAARVRPDKRVDRPAPKAAQSAPRSSGRERRRPVKAARPKVGVIEAAALFLMAGVIVATSRPGAGFLSRLTGGALSPLLTEGEVATAEALEPDRGRAAGSPLAIPAKGWKDVLARTWKEFNDDQVAAVAGGVTFFGLLALFPAVAAFVSLYGLFADVAKAREQLRLLAGFLPHDILAFVGDEMVRIAGGEHATLGLTFTVSLLFSLWSANGAVKALFHGLNIAFEERETRGIVKLNLVSLAFTLGAIVFSLLAVGAVVVAPVALGYLGLDAGAHALALLRWPVLMLILVGGLSLIYRYGPSRSQPRWRWLTPGGIVAALLWVGASLLFSWYVANFAHYDRTYGSLGAVIGFMFWLWYSMIIVLFGAELNAELEHQTAVDTTTGAPLPLGQRGAKMADTLGAVRGVKTRPPVAR